MLFSAAQPLASQVLSVSELNRLAREVLERNLPLLWVAGEVSNFRRHESGHCYFTLKDAQAQVDCVFFRHRAQLLGWLPRDGEQVEVRALPSFYEPRGRFQLNVETMRRAGLGALYEAFARLRARLEQEGLFDPARKRPLPRFPRAVGIVTSPAAAALRDVLTTLRRRMPSLPVTIYPAPVQGAGAAERIAEAIRIAGARRECDVLIVCRGGGGIEDLWAFNEEVVARAIRACPIPVVTGIGHETDFTIADFAADVRAPTPTGAAELASPNRQDLAKSLLHAAQRLARAAARALEQRMQRLDLLAGRLLAPGERIRREAAELKGLALRLLEAGRRGLEARAWRLRELALRLAARAPETAPRAGELAALAARLHAAARSGLERAQARLARAAAELRQLDPQRVLERGYSIAQTREGRIVRDADTLCAGQELRITLARGWAETRVLRTGRRSGEGES
jgi:exodeoxyribonuclease VII large subunit